MLICVVGIILYALNKYNLYFKYVRLLNGILGTTSQNNLQFLHFSHGIFEDRFMGYFSCYDVNSHKVQHFTEV